MVNGAKASFIVEEQGDGYPDYLSFTSTGNSTVSLTNEGDNAPTVYYSFDRETWTLWDYSAISLTDGQIVYMYGDNGGDGGQFSESNSKYSHFTMTGTLAGGGNIMSLLGEDFENYTAVGTRCFYYLFNDCYSLVSSPKFPAIILGNFCYCGCLANTSITESPYLPANPSNSCYSLMFAFCGSLANITIGATVWDSRAALNWVAAINDNGTFICPAELTIFSGVSGIPSGWTRVDL